MTRMFKLSLLGTVLAMSGCQAVNTTSGGVLGVERKQYMFSMFSTDYMHNTYTQSYQQTLGNAESKGVLVSNSKDSRRLDIIAKRLIAEVPVFRADAAEWDWQVNLIKSDELNANCGPGGKIIFYTGIIERLELTDDEIAAVMGHEIAHALREHGRERMTKTIGVQMAKAVGSAAGIDRDKLQIADTGVKYLMTLPNSRANENEADLIGLELAARGGYNPNASISLWEKMGKANTGAPPEFMSTHPASSSRITTLQAAIPKVMPLYEQKLKTSINTRKHKD